ncbi:hypothetical protein HPB47_027401, partial [Ixodes persulcatus]
MASIERSQMYAAALWSFTDSRIRPIPSVPKAFGAETALPYLLHFCSPRDRCYTFDLVRTLSWYLSRALQQRYNIKLKIGRFGFFSIQEVYLQFRDGTTLEVEQVWFTSSLFSTKYSSLFVVCLGDVRLQAHFDKLLENKPTKRLPPDKPPAQGKIQLPGKAMTFFKDTSTNDSCMVQFCVSIQSSITCSAVDLRVIHNASVDIRQPEILLYEDKLLEALSSREAPTSQELEHEEPEHDEEADVASSDKEPALGEDELRGLFLEVHSVTAELLRDAGEDSFATCLLTLSNLGLASDQFQVVSLKSAEAKFRLHHEQVDMNVRLASLHAAYSEEELNHWGRLLPPRRRSASVPAPHRSRSQSSLDKLFSLRMLVRATAELEDVSAQLKMTDCGPFSTGLVHARLNADIGSVLPIAGKDRGTRDISSEVMLETAWCTLSPVDVPRPQQLKKSHFWNVPFSVGMMLLKQLKKSHFWNVPFSVGMMLLKTRHTSQDLRIQCMLGSVHAEVNPRVTALLQQWCSRITSRVTLGRPGGASRAASPTLSVHLSLSDTNVFGVSSAETTLVARLDTLNVDCGTGKVYLNMDGCAVAPLAVAPQEVHLQLHEEATLSWSTTLHMSALTLAQDLESLRTSLKRPVTEESPKSKECSKVQALNISFQGVNTFQFVLSHSHRTLVIDEMRVVFPYQYNFAEVFSEEAVNIVKWIKLVHKRAKKPFTEDSPLPSDFSIKAKLLEDEYHESLKRKKMLDEKIETFRKTHLMLPASKVNELYATLTKKNADIYIQRSKQLYSGAPLRSRLVRWHFEQFELLALADPSYHGTQRVVELIQHLDPERGRLEFSTLWCRKVNGSIKAVTCQLRDFPQLLLDWRDFNWWGTLAGAEQEASHR